MRILHDFVAPQHLLSKVALLQKIIKVMIVYVLFACGVVIPNTSLAFTPAQCEPGNLTTIDPTDWAFHSGPNKPASKTIPSIIAGSDGVDHILMTTNDNGIGGEATTANFRYYLPAAGNLMQVEFDAYVASPNCNGSCSGKTYPNGADGLSVVFSDAAVAANPGPSGASLGYATDAIQANPGFTGGWLGFGINLSGNFFNKLSTADPASKSVQNSFAIRGSGGKLKADGSWDQSNWKTGYTFIAGSAKFPASTATMPWIGSQNATVVKQHYRITLDLTVAGAASATIERAAMTYSGSTWSFVLDGGGNYTYNPSYALTVPNIYANLPSQAPIPKQLMMSISGSTATNWSTNQEIANVSLCATLQPIKIATQPNHFELTFVKTDAISNDRIIKIKACANSNDNCAVTLNDPVSLDLNGADDTIYGLGQWVADASCAGNQLCTLATNTSDKQGVTDGHLVGIKSNLDSSSNYINSTVSFKGGEVWISLRRTSPSDPATSLVTPLSFGGSNPTPAPFTNVSSIWCQRDDATSPQAMTEYNNTGAGTGTGVCDVIFTDQASTLQCVGPSKTLDPVNWAFIGNGPANSIIVAGALASGVPAILPKGNSLDLAYPLEDDSDTDHIILTTNAQAPNNFGQATAANFRYYIPADNNYVRIEFDSYQYHPLSGFYPMGVEGLAVVLSDASVAASPGYPGAALGYTIYKGSYPASAIDVPVNNAGFAGGWLGLGLNLSGHFNYNLSYYDPASISQGTGTSNSTNNSFTLRGSGGKRASDGTWDQTNWLSGYGYIAGTSSFPTTGANAQPPIGSLFATPAPVRQHFRMTLDLTQANKAPVKIERALMTKSSGSWKIVTDANGFPIYDANSTLTVNDIYASSANQAPPPKNLMLSFAGATWMGYGVHQALSNIQLCATHVPTPIPVFPHHLKFEYTPQWPTCMDQPITITPCGDATCTVPFLSKVETTENLSLVGGSITPYTCGQSIDPTTCNSSTAANISSDGQSVIFPANSSAPVTVLYHHPNLTQGGIGLANTASLAPFTNYKKQDCNATTNTNNICTIDFQKSGFMFTNKLSTLNFVANKSQDVLITAYRDPATTGNTGNTSDQCAVLFAGTKTLNFTSSYVDPVAGSQKLSLDVSSDGTDTGMTGSPTVLSATPQAINVTFDANGTALLQMNYPDAGTVGLQAQYTVTDADGTLVMDNTDLNSVYTPTFRPYGFCIESEQDAACDTANNADGSINATVDNYFAACHIYKAAGAQFPLAVTPKAWMASDISPSLTSWNHQMCSSGRGSTPNFTTINASGWNNPLVLNPTIVAPAGGNASYVALNSSSDSATTAADAINFTANTTGTNCTNLTDVNCAKQILNLRVGNVGIYQFKLNTISYYGDPSLTIPSSASEPVGAFVPDHFVLTSPTVTNANILGAKPFTYMSQPGIDVNYTVVARGIDADPAKCLIATINCTETSNYEHFPVAYLAKLSSVNLATADPTGADNPVTSYTAQPRWNAGATIDGWSNDGLTPSHAIYTYAISDGEFIRNTNTPILITVGSRGDQINGQAFADINLDGPYLFDVVLGPDPAPSWATGSLNPAPLSDLFGHTTTANQPIRIGISNMTPYQISSLDIRFGRLQMPDTIAGKVKHTIPVPVQAQYFDTNRLKPGVAGCDYATGVGCTIEPGFVPNVDDNETLLDDPNVAATGQFNLAQCRSKLTPSVTSYIMRETTLSKRKLVAGKGILNIKTNKAEKVNYSLTLDASHSSNVTEGLCESDNGAAGGDDVINMAVQPLNQPWLKFNWLATTYIDPYIAINVTRNGRVANPQIIYMKKH